MKNVEFINNEIVVFLLRKWITMNELAEEGGGGEEKKKRLGYEGWHKNEEFLIAFVVR